MAARSTISFHRCISPALEDALLNGALRWLMDVLRSHVGVLDIQTRADGRETWITAYAGLTSVLDVREMHGRVRLTVHKTHQLAAGFDPKWSSTRDPVDLANDRSEIEAYLARVLADGGVNTRYTAREGVVQTSLSSAKLADVRMIQREAVLAFSSSAVRDSMSQPFRDRILAAVSPGPESPPWWPMVRDRGALPRLGNEADLLGVDSGGRLLAVEVKPAQEVKGITWAPAQARMYAELFALWLDTDEHACESLDAMAAQRHRLGLMAKPFVLPERSNVRVVPVVAIGPGARSEQAFSRLEQIHHRLSAAPPESPRVDPMEIWLLRSNGEINERFILDTNGWDPVR